MDICSKYNSNSSENALVAALIAVALIQILDVVETIVLFIHTLVVKVIPVILIKIRVVERTIVTDV